MNTYLKLKYRLEPFSSKDRQVTVYEDVATYINQDLAHAHPQLLDFQPDELLIVVNQKQHLHFYHADEATQLEKKLQAHPM